MKIINNGYTSQTLRLSYGVSRRLFLKYALGSMLLPYSGWGWTKQKIASVTYPIEGDVATTVDCMLSFAIPALVKEPGSRKGLARNELHLVSEYEKYGYGEYSFGPGLPVVQRLDLMPKGYDANRIYRLQQLSSFFTVSDIHLTDKQAGNQLIALQWMNKEFGADMTSLYSPTMLTTTQVFDAAIQTVNVLHQRTPFDFGLSLGDTCNSTQYNETRWYLDIMDGKDIYPNSSGDDTQNHVSYQRPYKSAGLHSDIPWYQINGNHDLFMIGSVSVDADPSLGLRDAYVSNRVWAIGDLLKPIEGFPNFPCIFDTTGALKLRNYYMGTINGASETGEIINVGPVASFAAPPFNPPNRDRRSLTKKEWIAEFFDSSTLPKGHGFHLIDPEYAQEEPGFCCYSFLPKPEVPLRIIALDNVQDPRDGSQDVHGHGYLSHTRLKWLRAQLRSAKESHELVIIASHVPLAVMPIGSEMEWWESSRDPHATLMNAISLKDLIAEIQSNGQVLCWLAGHRHVNTVKVFMPLVGLPLENGFWQIETSSLHDFPQQFRTIKVYLNSDYSVSIVAINVDPAVREGSPAANGRRMGIAAQQIVQSDKRPNAPNVDKAFGAIPVPSMDPTRPQDGSIDPSIHYGNIDGVPYCASYNAELFKMLPLEMVAILKMKYPS